eukprot:CAMPEP_0171235840 /NCGR_PEP_ID=MMETSP0790-20130122/42146_1 /TAXON_ID=2925 /ORGANISM="Alexandrium catenella, Strain OF101" /LENGTH=427 /DNA_ID=CAMNT_0011702149 /DNA_START=1 /DNA_END=1282 /DNA_ORIENTATION=+
MVAASLQNSKWDKRAQALKAVSSVLKGLEVQGRAPPGSTGALGKGLRLHDRTVCWRTGCLLLNLALRDKVIPLRLAALELFLDTFSNSAVGGMPQAEVRLARRARRAPDRQARGFQPPAARERAEVPPLHGRALRPPGFGAGACETASAAQQGREERREGKVHFGILDAVNFLLQHFPGSRGSGHIDEDLDEDEAETPHAAEDSWTQSDIGPFIIAGMDDSLGPRVRDIAATLAVTVYQTFGMEAMKPVLAELRPAKQALLKQKFEEFEGFDPAEDGEDGEEGPELRPADLEGLVICGNAIKPLKPATAAAATAPPPLPGCVNVDYDEEFVMDGILEDAGMVFNGTGMVGNGGGFQAGAASSQRLPPGFLEQHLGLSGMDLDEDDHRFLEEELSYLGLGDMEALAEQQALLLSLQEGHGLGGNRGLS